MCSLPFNQMAVIGWGGGWWDGLWNVICLPFTNDIFVMTKWLLWPIYSTAHTTGYMRGWCVVVGGMAVGVVAHLTAFPDLPFRAMCVGGGGGCCNTAHCAIQDYCIHHVSQHCASKTSFVHHSLVRAWPSHISCHILYSALLAVRWEGYGGHVRCRLSLLWSMVWIAPQLYKWHALYI